MNLPKRPIAGVKCPRLIFLKKRPQPVIYILKEVFKNPGVRLRLVKKLNKRREKPLTGGGVRGEDMLIKNLEALNDLGLDFYDLIEIEAKIFAEYFNFSIGEEPEQIIQVRDVFVVVDFEHDIVTITGYWTRDGKKAKTFK